MTRFITATALVALTAAPAFAAVDLDQLDMTGDGFVSMEEVMAAYPDFAPESWGDIDTNDDRRLSSEEILQTEAQDIFARYEMLSMEERGRVIVLDEDGDGFIQASDFERAYADFDAEDFEMIDTNDDNRVSYEEYYAPEAQQTIERYSVNVENVTDNVLDIAEIDTNGDSFADFDEMVAAYPGLATVDFEEIDANDDNRISSEELYAPEAQEIVSRSNS